MLARFLQVIVAYFWSTFALIVLCAAVFVSAVRLMLPQISDYRDEIESWVSSYMEQPVEIDEIEAEWRGWTPHLRMKGIRLLDATENRVLTRFDQADLTIEILGTIIQRELVPGTLTVSGVELMLLRRPNGAITIEGVAPESAEIPSVRRNALAYWLQNQKNLTIESAKISWRDDHSLIKPVILSDVSLSIRSRGQHRQVEGSARLPADIGKKFNFILDVDGDLLTDEWSGDLYIEGEAIDPSVVLNYSRWMGLKLTDGKLGFQIWSRWAGARLLSIDGMFALDGVEIGVEGYRVQVTEGTGDVHAVRHSEGRWSMSLERLNLATPEGSWPETELFLSLTRSADSDKINTVTQASFLRLDDLSPIVPSLGIVPESIRSSIQKMQPRGDLHNLRVGYFPDRPADQRFYLRSEFANISVNPVDRIPGLSGLRGSIKADASGGELNLSTDELSIDFAERLDSPLLVNRLSGDIRWVTRSQGWWLATNSLRIETSALHTDTAGTLEWRSDDAPVANLITTVSHGEFEYLPKLIPNGVLPERGYNWLQNAIVGGKLASGIVVVRGPLNDFPFDETSGVFKARFTIEDGILDFHTAWPRMEELNAELLFDGHQMFFNAASAKLLGADLYDIETTIPDLMVKKRVLKGTTKARFSSKAGIAVVGASPMKRTIGERLAELDISGPMELDLGMTIPLEAGHKPSSKGVLKFDANTISAPQMKVTLEELKGQLRFVNKDWSIENTTAKYLDQDVAVSGEGGPVTDGSRDEMRLAGDATVETVHRQLEILAPGLTNWLDAQALFTGLQGAAHWQASIVRQSQAGKQPTRTLALDSELQGFELDIPSPLGKQAAESRHLHLETGPIAERDSTISFNYADAIAGRLAFRRDDAGEKQLLATALSFGGGALPDQPLPGIHVTGKLTHFSLDDWLATLREGDHSPDPAAHSIRPPLPTIIDVGLGSLRALGQDFKDVGFFLKSGEQDWQAELAGDDVQGQITAPFIMNSGTIIGQFEHMALAKNSSGQATIKADPTNLPAVELTVDNFRFEQIELGSLYMRTIPSESGLTLEQLTFSADDFAIEAKGDWLSDGSSQRSQFEIDVQGDDLGKLLSNFGYQGAAINGGDTAIQILAEWPGAPTDFSLTSLNGDLKLEVEQGTLLDVDPKAGRLFGLLSMTALRRRLTLDFNDLFSKGFAFDRIEGAFELDHGDAYTSNLSMDGPSARVDISGRTGLADQDYDQLVTVTPQLASSLPVAGAFFGPAGAGVGAVLFLGQKVFKGLPNQLDSMLKRQYTITGNWDEPVIERIKAKRRRDDPDPSLSSLELEED